MMGWQQTRLSPYKSAPWDQVISFMLIQEGSEGVAFGRNVEMEKVPEGSWFGSPTFRLDLEQAQELFDHLYALGLRPSRPADEANASIERHLLDMRAIAFAKLNIPQP